MAEVEALHLEQHETKSPEISVRGHMALDNFLTGTSDMRSPMGGSRMYTLATVIEEGSPTESSTPSEYEQRLLLLVYS